MSQKRIVIVVVLFCIPFLLLTLQLFSLQVVGSSHYRAEAQKQSTRIEQIPAGRGKLLDRNGTLLASSDTLFDLYITLSRFSPQPKSSANTNQTLVPVRESSPLRGSAPPVTTTDQTILPVMTMTEQTEQTIKRLAKVLSKKPEAIKAELTGVTKRIEKLLQNKTLRDQRIILRQNRSMKYRFITNVTLDSALEIETNPQLFPGITVSENIRRLYQNKTCASHAIGYMGFIKDYARLKKANYFRSLLNPQVDDGTYEILLNRGDFMDDLIGITGIEKYYQITLSGQSGIKFVETDYLNKQRRELSRISPIHGTDLTLTIDKNLQMQIEHAMKTKIGAAVVLDVQNGEVLALASSPDYDPNKLMSPVSPETVQYIFQNTTRPLYNRAVNGEYALGSIFKIITGIAALEEGKINQWTSFNCDGYFSRTSRHFKCWVAEYQRQHGRFTIEEGLKHSCNVFFFNAGKFAGAGAITNWAGKFGFGQPTGIDLPGEAKGLLPDPIRGAERGRRAWATADTLNLSIGQGDLMVTPIQVARMMAAIANGGTLVTPHLVSQTGKSYPTTKINISAKTLSIVSNGLYSVVNSEGGTAYGRGLGGYRLCGKTSTAEVGKGRSHGWFAGFGPYPNPKFAFVIVIEHGGKGSEAAAPVAAEFIPAALACFSNPRARGLTSPPDKTTAPNPEEKQPDDEEESE